MHAHTHPGVEDAFYHSNRVVTLSLHKRSPGFFPGQISSCLLVSRGYLSVGPVLPQAVEHWTVLVPVEGSTTASMYRCLTVLEMTSITPSSPG